MTVVSDTSAINYLLLTGETDILPQLYGGVTLAPEVVRELSAVLSPALVRRWAQAPPAWVQIGAVPLPATLSSIDPALDRGEREAIALAVELDADLILMDDAQGRKEAKRLGLEHTGTLGILLAASKLHLVDLSDAIRRLRQSGFFVSDAVVRRVLDLGR